MPAISDRLIRTGSWWRRKAADPAARRLGPWHGRRAVLILLAIAALALDHDRGPPLLSLTPVGYGDLSGWEQDDLSQALATFLRSCGHFLSLPGSAPFYPRAGPVDFGRIADWRKPCRRAASVPKDDEEAVRRFFERDFVPMAVADLGDPLGLFTGYYEIVLAGSRRRHGPYRTPLYRLPSDPMLARRYSRAQIDDGALDGQDLAIAWAKSPIDAFFLQIQGSGVIRLDAGGRIRLGYAGDNGKPYVAIGRMLIADGAIARARVTMQAIRAWMTDHPEKAAALRRSDPSYVYFRQIKGKGPVGAEHVVLTPGRSLAVDRAFLPLGVPIWLDAEERYAPRLRLRRLVVAQDVGGAIRGPVRGDLFWGTGTKAGARAGAMNAAGRYFVLLPRTVAKRLVAMRRRR